MALPTEEERIRRKKIMKGLGMGVPNTDTSWGPWWDKQWKNAEIIKRKYLMQDAGIHVPNTDESWGPWWNEQWEKAITRTKDNDYYGVPSSWNIVRRAINKITGNTTYEAEPQPTGGTIQATDESTGAQIKRTLNNWQHYGDPVRDVTMLLMPDPSKPIKASKAAVKAVPQLVKSVPKLFTKEGAKKVGAKTAKTVIREVPKATVGWVGGKTVDYVSEATTGKSWAENASDKMSSMMGFHIEPIFGEATNPGYGYGYFVGNNFSNLGRYTLDNLRPWGYAFNKEQLGGIGKAFIQPFYKTPPTFFTHRPKWYTSREGTWGGGRAEFLEARFENGANWAGIPEAEVPRVHFARNSDGTVSPTHIHNRTIVGKEDFHRPGQTIVDLDDITLGRVGGDHSDYTYLGDDLAGNSLFQYSDRQRLNPQWKISDRIKNKFNLQEGSKAYNLVHRLGGIDLSPILGYKPFTIEFMYGKQFSPGPIQTTDAILIENANKAFTNPKP